MRRSVPLIAKAWVLWPPGHDIPEDRVQTMVSGCAPQNVKCNAHMTVFDSFRTRLTNEFERRGCWFMVEVSNWVVGLLRRILWLSRCLAVNECGVSWWNEKSTSVQQGFYTSVGKASGHCARRGGAPETKRRSMQVARAAAKGAPLESGRTKATFCPRTY